MTSATTADPAEVRPPRRLISAYWLIGLGAYTIAKVAFATGYRVLRGGQAYVDVPMAGILFGLVVACAFAVALIVAGMWMRAAKPKGHYLAAALLALMLALSLLGGLNPRLLLVLVFFVILVGDIRRLRSDPGFSLTAGRPDLDDFWPYPWLVSVTLANSVTGGLPDLLIIAAVHALTPVLVVFVHVKLVRSPNIQRGPTLTRYRSSLALWALFYVLSVVAGVLFLIGLGQGLGSL